MKIYVKRIDGLTLPKAKTSGAAAYDVVATSDPKIVGVPGVEEEGKVKFWKRIDYIEYETNLFTSPEVQTSHILIHPRSSARNFNLQLANGIGLIDYDYRGMWKCCFNYLWQPEDLVTVNGEIMGKVNYDKIHKKGEGIVQVLGEMTVHLEWILVDELDKTERGEGGFGSTDTPHIAPGPHMGITTMFEKSGHNIQTPPKNAYVNAIKEREKGVE